MKNVFKFTVIVIVSFLISRAVIILINVYKTDDENNYTFTYTDDKGYRHEEKVNVVYINENDNFKIYDLDNGDSIIFGDDYVMYGPSNGNMYKDVLKNGEVVLEEIK